MCRFKNKKGFSLIEIMVVVAIMGILASIGIPQYLEYRNTAFWGRVNSELNSIGRAFSNCIASMRFNQCDSAGELGVAEYEFVDSGNTNASFFETDAGASRICADFVRNIGGNTIEACVQAVSGTQTVSIDIQTDRRFCGEDGTVTTVTWNSGDTRCDTNVQATASGSYTCMTGATETGSCGSQCGDMTIIEEECTTAGDCTGQGYDYCRPAPGTNAGVCSTAGVCQS